METSRRSPEEKLRLLAAGEEIGLTAGEAAVYGVDYADHGPEGQEEAEEYG